MDKEGIPPEDCLSREGGIPPAGHLSGGLPEGIIDNATSVNKEGNPPERQLSSAVVPSCTYDARGGEVEPRVRGAHLHLSNAFAALSSDEEFEVGEHTPSSFVRPVVAPTPTLGCESPANRLGLSGRAHTTPRGARVERGTERGARRSPLVCAPCGTEQPAAHGDSPKVSLKLPAEEAQGNAIDFPYLLQTLSTILRVFISQFASFFSHLFLSSFRIVTV